MKLLWLIPLALCLVLVPTAVVLASNGGSGFDGVVDSIESRYNVHATRMPLMGVVSLISRSATHGGVSGIRVADIENFSQPVNGEELNRIVEEKLGQGWQRMIRETSRNGNEQTLIFVRPEGNRMGMFIVEKDSSEMNVVQVSVDPDHLNESIGKYGHNHRDGDRSNDESE